MAVTEEKKGEKERKRGEKKEKEREREKKRKEKREKGYSHGSLAYIVLHALRSASFTDSGFPSNVRHLGTVDVAPHEQLLKSGAVRKLGPGSRNHALNLEVHRVLCCANPQGGSSDAESTLGINDRLRRDDHRGATGVKTT